MSQPDEISTSPPKPKRRWYQFSLRTLLIFMLVCGVGLGFFGRKAEQVRRQRLAIAAIEKASGGVIWDFEWIPYPKKASDVARVPTVWRSLLGDDFFDKVVVVSIAHDAEMEYLKEFPDLKELDIQCSHEISDAGLNRLRDVPQLQVLTVGMCEQIHGSSLAKLKCLENLKSLDLTYLELHDDALEHLNALTQLKELNIVGDFSEEGLHKLRTALPNCAINAVVLKRPNESAPAPAP